MGLESGAQPFVSSLFESLGYRSRSVFDLTQASDVVTRDGDKWGVLLVDADVVGDDGVKNCEQLLDKFPDICVLVMSASPFEGRAGLAASRRVAYVEKPLGVWSVESLLKRFRTESGAL
jgi:CheY-like chemotaxis protein